MPHISGDNEWTERRERNKNSRLEQTRQLLFGTVEITGFLESITAGFRRLGQHRDGLHSNVSVTVISPQADSCFFFCSGEGDKPWMCSWYRRELWRNMSPGPNTDHWGWPWRRLPEGSHQSPCESELLGRQPGWLTGGKTGRGACLTNQHFQSYKYA